MMKYTVDDGGIRSRLSDMLGRLEDPSPLMGEIAGDLHDSIEESFEREADPVTRRPWRDLSAEHIARREAAGLWPGKKLQMRGLMAASVQSGYSATAAWAGTNRRQALTHQEGDEERGIPQRRFVGLWDEHRHRIIRRLTQYVTG